MINVGGATSGVFGGTDPTIATQLAEKLNKGKVSVLDIDKTLGKLDQTFMSDAFLQQMAGNTPINAVPADNSLTPNKFAFPVTKGVQGKNLFDKSTALPNSYITSSGTVATSNGWYASDWISIQPNTPYYKNTYNSVAFYDANKVFISYSTSGQKALTSPANAYYLRLSISNTDSVTINTAQLELGTVGTPYEPFNGKTQVDDIKGLNDKLRNYAYRGIKNKNLFDKGTVTPGAYVNYTNGLVSPVSANNASDYIPVTPSTAYYKNKTDQYAFYDINKLFISGAASGNSFTTPSNAYFMRITVKDADLETTQLELGTAGTAYQTGLPLIKKEQVIDLPSFKGLSDTTLIVAKYGGDYATIQAAVDAINDSSPTKRYTILVMPGIYEESVSMYDKYIDLVALNLGSVVIIEKSGQYYTPPIEMSSRNNLKNLIIKATHDNVGTYTGEPSYAVHHDYDGEGENWIENCKLISYQSSAFGCGSHNNQQIHLKNCELITDTTGVTWANGGTNRPALLFHPYPFTATNQKLIVENCRLKANTGKVLSLIDSNNNGTVTGATADNRDTTVGFYNNTFWSDATGKTDVVYKPTGALTAGAIDGYIKLTPDSFGNNIPEVNA